MPRTSMESNKTAMDIVENDLITGEGTEEITPPDNGTAPPQPDPVKANRISQPNRTDNVANTSGSVRGAGDAD
jgi:hypothetical protein